MNNNVEFVAPAHSLLMKAEMESSTHQESKNRAASIQASPQAAHKKRFTKFDISMLVTMWSDNIAPTHDEITRQDGNQKVPPCDTTRITGSIGHPAARNRFSYD
ncbi:unnamed protein product [Sphagnum jensenii]|jgi:hypothetical protein|uniref:Uncharacterized protein n=1 Tax=Sphagnum jensenii TaxID=128206 RepID=A0ABP0WLV1_9BRYO